jgi:hypothetical protein
MWATLLRLLPQNDPPLPLKLPPALLNSQPEHAARYQRAKKQGRNHQGINIQGPVVPVRQVQRQDRDEVHNDRDSNHKARDSKDPLARGVTAALQTPSSALSEGGGCWGIQNRRPGGPRRWRPEEPRSEPSQSPRDSGRGASGGGC